MFGIKTFVAIINPPQASLLATGEIKERPVAIDNRIGDKAYDGDDSILRSSSDGWIPGSKIPAGDKAGIGKTVSFIN